MVVATNVAETSITLPDVTVVIDAGRVKENGAHARICTPTHAGSFPSCIFLCIYGGVVFVWAGFCNQVVRRCPAQSNTHTNRTKPKKSTNTQQGTTP